MSLFGRIQAEVEPTPFVALLCDRLGVDYGGWDTLAPLSPSAGEPGIAVTFHIDDGTTTPREIPLRGTGIVREARAFSDRTEVYDGGTLLARYDDLTSADAFAQR